MPGKSGPALVLPGPAALRGEIATEVGKRQIAVRQLSSISDLHDLPPDVAPETIVIPTLWMDMGEGIAELGGHLITISDALKSSFQRIGSYPRYVPVVAPGGGDATTASGRNALKTFIGYLTSHLINEDVRINAVLCHHDLQGYRDAARAVAVLTSGLLDDVKGQTLELDRGGA